MRYDKQRKSRRADVFDFGRRLPRPRMGLPVGGPSSTIAATKRASPTSVSTVNLVHRDGNYGWRAEFDGQGNETTRHFFAPIVSPCW